MSLVVIIVIALVAAALVGVLVLVGMRASKLGQELETAEHKIESLQGEARALVAKIQTMQEADTKKNGWLDNMEHEINHYRAELDQRPKIQRKTYRILTLGMKATGKTSLTLKWSNPHVFEVHDWGGEHIVDAQQELIVEEIHGLLVVVDLGGRDARQVEASRVSEQLQEFQPQALRYFFGPKTVASCKTVVLFINKSDLISGTPAEVEQQAMRLYQPLIDNLMKYANQIDVKVFVGSANYGHSTHFLFSHFVEKILPKSAYDNQLLQRMKADFSNMRSSQFNALPPPSNGPGTPPPAGAGFGPPPQRPAPQLQQPAVMHFSGAPQGLGDTAPLLHHANSLPRKA
jgi:signal recognition particle receptor subunit beta